MQNELLTVNFDKLAKQIGELEITMRNRRCLPFSSEESAMQKKNKAKGDKKGNRGYLFKDGLSTF